MTEKLTLYDPAEDLVSDTAIATFMAEAFETEDAGYIAHALGVVARAKGMSDPQDHPHRDEGPRPGTDDEGSGLREMSDHRNITAHNVVAQIKNFLQQRMRERFSSWKSAAKKIGRPVRVIGVDQREQVIFAVARQLECEGYAGL